MRRRFPAALLSVCAAACGATLNIPSMPGPLTIDGDLGDPGWNEARVLPLEGGGETRIGVRSGYLCVSARVPERGRVVAGSLGQNPAWGNEDLVVWRFSVHLGARNRTLTLIVNPLGAFSFEENGVLATARMGAGAWTAEGAIPIAAVSDLGFLSVERIRPPRPDAPELRWQWPAPHERAAFELPASARSAPVEPPAFVAAPRLVAASEARRSPEGPLAAEVAALSGEILPDGAKALRKDLEERMAAAAANERRAWEEVRTRADWERFRDARLAALRKSLGPFPPRTPLRAEVTRRADYGDGFVIENIVFESRPRLLVTANLYLPTRISGSIPAIVVVHSHHAPKVQSELQDLGMTWARSGAAVLVMDQLGAGERVQSQAWPRESYYSRYALGMQLHLAGESLMKWMVWDLMRGIDVLLERPYIDGRRIVMLGAVAGGGDPAAVTAALDERVAAVIPFNFGEAGPEEHYTQGPRPYDARTADPGWGSWESTRNLRRSAVDQFFPWFLCASVAPRPFLYAFEIGWPKTVEEEPAWARYKRVFEFYGARDRLAEVHGFGPFPGPGECTNVGTFLRKGIYPVVKRWLDVPVPAAEYHNPRPDADLMCLTPAVAEARRPLPASALAAAIARERLAAARTDSSGLRAALQAKLGDIEPSPQATARVLWTRRSAKFTQEGISVDTAPALLLRPATAGERVPVVLALAQQGTRQWVLERSNEIAKLLEARIAVCLAEVRTTARTPGAMDLASTELMLGNTLIGAQLKDTRAVVRYLAQRADLDPKRIVLWGDSFAPPNPRNLPLDKSVAQRFGPQIQTQAEPASALLALLTTLYEPEVKAVAARRGLVSFQSVLADRFTYVPLDAIVPGLLEAGDVPQIVAALAPRPVLLQSSVDGRNRPAGEDAPPARTAEWILGQCGPPVYERVNYHRVTSKRSPAPEPGAENTPLLSPLERPNGSRVDSAEEWYRRRRPELVKAWTAILGKIAPAPEDMQWFGDVRGAVEMRRNEMDGYTRIDLDIPLERDFYQRHLLLLPKDQGEGPFPAVIAWTSSTPDYQQPEPWWGAWLARRGYVVLTSWAFIRNYREGTRGRQAAELVYQRFGHWLGMGKMVHDVAREIEYLRALPQVDGKRIGFMGFSLSAKTAVYVAAFNPDVKVTVAIDPHIAINGGTNWYAPWYLDWRRHFDDIHTPDYPVPELRGTVQSLLNPDVRRPGFEHDHQELLALAAPRAFLLIGGSQSEDAGGDSDDLESWGYVNRAREVYTLLGVPERLQFCSTDQGHKATGDESDPVWQAFLQRYLVDQPIEFEGYR